MFNVKRTLTLSGPLIQSVDFYSFPDLFHIILPSCWVAHTHTERIVSFLPLSYCGFLLYPSPLSCISRANRDKYIYLLT